MMMLKLAALAAGAMLLAACAHNQDPPGPAPELAPPPSALHVSAEKPSAAVEPTAVKAPVVSLKVKPKPKAKPKRRHRAHKQAPDRVAVPAVEQRPPAPPPVSEPAAAPAPEPAPAPKHRVPAWMRWPF
jgi:hypothetical protein